ncbi:hypothetical protein [Breoghania sp.]|uniref:hypothetical protein n=1 Tax=Breoghania sp. TaxID=2065378 RepID=UPI00261C733F|nr:hypothetical protein [Breoghania sp.]MDJ0932178.1 hypothetical protein [Breoghania sp.]
MDEPTSNLDPASAAHIETLVQEYAHAGTRILFVGHDMGQARRLADDLVFMHCGRIVAHEPAVPFFDNPRNPLAARFLAGELLVEGFQELNREEDRTP